MDTPRRIVIVGAGLASARAVDALRQEGFDGEVTVIGAEAHPPYERPPLSKGYLLGKDDLSGAFPHDREWYADHGVRLLTGTPATALDLAGGVVRLDGGAPVVFDALLLATGATPRVPALPGAERAHTLRTIEDSDRLKDALARGGRLVIIGGGWIGLEVAAAARTQGLGVTVLEREELPLREVLGERVARYLVDLHASHGVDVRTRVDVEAIEDGGVRTDAGLVEADHVLLAVGAVPETRLAEAAGLSVDNGVVVDEHLRASDPRVFAAGDVANARNASLGRSLRVEHWDNAVRQGALAARTMLGRDDRYDWAPYFYTDQFEFSMEYVGHGSADDDVEIRGDLGAGEFVAYWLAGDTVTAGMNVNTWDVNDRLRELVGTTVDRAALTDLR